MKKAKLLALLLAGSLLFHTAGIDVLATTLSDPVLADETIESTDNDNSEQSSEEKESNADQPSEKDDESKDSSEEEGNTEQPSEEGDNEDDEIKDSSEEEDNTEQPSEEDDESENPADNIEFSEDSVSENTISENTISENTLPEDDANLFSIFPGLGDDYKFSSQQLADKKVLASHVGDVVSMNIEEATSIEDFADTSGEYELGEVVYLADTEAEAEQVAKAFGGTLESYSYEVAVITLPKRATVALAIAAAAEPDIKLPAVWPNYYQYLDSDINATTNPLTPSDPGYVNQWQHDYIGTRYAWAAGFKGQGIKIAVIDTGLKKGHEDLGNNALTGKNFVGLEKDQKAPDYNNDNQTHGTHVAGIIAADDNGKGVIGIAPDANVRGYCVFSASGGASSSDVKRAINAAVEDGNDIINMSLGSTQYDADYEKVVKDAYESGVAIFASSGNDDTDGYSFPAAYASTISVGAVDENSTRASFSNYGKTVTLSFPGVNIYSTTNAGYKEGTQTYGDYGYMSGTSQAAPAAAGTAAVILSAREDIRKKTGKAKVDALLSAMKSSTTKCAGSGMGAGTTYLPGVLKIATDMTAPDAPVIDVIENVNGTPIARGTNKKDYIAESIDVTLSAKTAVGVDIYYSTDGKAPAYKNGQITNVDNPDTPYQIGDKITLTGAKSKTIKAIAVNPISGKTSKVVSKTVTLTPTPNKVTVVPVDNVTKIAAGKSLKFTATVTPSYSISNKVQWSVNDKATKAGITVSNGTVKTKATTVAGEYTVTAKAVGSDGKTFNGQTGTYTFTVIDAAAIKKIAFLDADTNRAPKAKSIKTTDSQTTDTDNKVIDLKDYLTVTKTDAASKADTILNGESAAEEVVWSSSNTKVATVSNGVISAVSPGKATIKAISNDGGNKSASYNVTIVQPVTSITIDGPKKVAIGKGITLTAKVTDNATNKKVTWTISGDGQTVSINKTNGKITTKKNAKAGDYTVKAIAADGLGASSTDYTITVVSEEITAITLNTKSLTLFPLKTSAAANKTTATLSATVSGKIAGNSKATTLTDPLIAWSSNAPSIAAVDEYGKITAKAPGKATITCASTDGTNKKATCTVNVATPMSKLVIGPVDGNNIGDGSATGVIAVGKKVNMAAKYYSNYGTPTNKKITWAIVGASADVPQNKVSINQSNGTVSVTKDMTPSNNSYIVVQATAQDGSGVTSNTYKLVVKPNYLKAQIVYSANGGFIMLASTKARPTNSTDWEWVPDYCTATMSGPKNAGLDKNTGRLADDSTNSIYAVYSPQPIKWTSKNLDFPQGLKTNELDKFTLTIKLKDGSNLTAKKTIYAVNYINSKGERKIAYLE